MATEQPTQKPLDGIGLDDAAAVLMARWGTEDTDEGAYDAAVADLRALEAAGYRIVDGALLDEIHGVSEQLRRGVV